MTKTHYMQSMLRRFKYFGIGFGIGLVFVFFFFGNRGCTWLPGGRVKTTIAGKIIVVEENTQKTLSAKGIGTKEIIDILNNGDVDFGGSNKQGNPQVYLIEGEVNGKNQQLWFTLPRDGFISEVRIPEGNIQLAKNTTKGFGNMIHFPNVKMWVYVDPNSELNGEITKADCGNEKDVQKALIKSGKIDFANSNLTADPSPEHYILFESKSKKLIGSRCTWFQEHVKITNFYDESKTK